MNLSDSMRQEALLIIPKCWRIRCTSKTGQQPWGQSRKDDSRNWGNLTRNGLWLKSVHWAPSCTGIPGCAALVGLQMNVGQMVLSPDVSRAPFKVVTAAIVKWERDYQILTCSDTFLLVGLTRAWLYKMNDIDIYLTFIIYVHLVYDIPNHCAQYHCIGLVTFLLNTTRIPMTPVPWILNSLLLHLILSHKLTMTWWEIKAEIIPCSTDFAN